MSRVLIPGSFDPITVGHLDMITRAAKRFDEVTVVIMNNDTFKYVPDAPVKKYMFTMKERREMVTAACAELSNVHVLSAGGLLIKIFDVIEADWILKGVRSTTDFEYEQQHAIWNRAHEPQAETLYMPADPAYAHVSSSLVRETILKGESLEGLVPPAVATYIAEHSRSI